MTTSNGSGTSIWVNRRRQVMLAGLGAIVLPASSSEQRPPGLVGHWRKTTVQFGEPIDTNLVLNGDGGVAHWTVTAHLRSAMTKGKWRVEGKQLLLRMASDGQLGNEESAPFTFHDGKLVLPNIEGQRGFWERQ